MPTALEIIAPGLLDQLWQAHADELAERHAILAALARSHALERDYDGYGAAVLRRLGLTPPASGWPPAVMTAAFDLGRAPAPEIVRADPVFLRADVSRLVLFDGDTIGVEDDEAEAILALLNAAFTDQGLRFSRARRARRWYLEGAPAAQAHSAAPADLNGQALEPSLADQRGLGKLKRILTEVQMLLHDCAPNERRIAAGRPPVNSVWLWGGEAQPAGAAPAVDCMVSDDSLVQACAAHCAVACRPAADADWLDAVLAGGHERVVVACPPGAAAPSLDIFSAHFFAPARRALRARQLRALTVTTAAGSFRLQAGDGWRIWRRTAAFVQRYQPQPGLEERN